MKCKTKIIITALIVFLIALAPIMFFFGNPLSYLLIPLRGNAYLKDVYPELDVQISEVRYDFKHGGWSAVASSPTSRDTWFRVYIDGFGNVEGDAYPLVLSHSTTASRLGQEYKDLAEAVFSSGDFPVAHSIAYANLTSKGGVQYYSVPGANGELQYFTMEKDYGLDTATLELDADYDVWALGARHGRITIIVHDPQVSAERAAEILLELRAYLDEQEVPFHGIHFHLTEPLNESGQNVSDVQLDLYDFLYTDIYEEGLTARVQAAWEETQAHYARMETEIHNEKGKECPL